MADHELKKLAWYMVHIASVNDFRVLAHKVSNRGQPLTIQFQFSSPQNWKTVVKGLPPNTLPR